jgi:general secretion pathway protein G
MVFLEGEQCLVFFLGGIPQVNPDGSFTPTGFSTNPSNPAQAGGDRIPPFFGGFKSNRLVQWPGTAPGFPSYIDGYGKTPYAYFSSYKTANGYNRYVYIPNPYLPLVQGNPVTSDCQALPSVDQFNNPTNGVFPYIQAGLLPYPPYPAPPPGATPPGANNPVYMNSQTFQLISAGKNYTFGPGCLITGYPGFGPANPGNWYGAPLASNGSPMWTPSNASALNGYQQSQAGHDDISNFYDRLLGVASQ